MTFSQLERDAWRVAYDLNTGNAEDAAAVLRQEMYFYPLEFSTFLYEVNRLSSPNRRDDILYDSTGNLMVKDRYTGYTVMVGKPGFPSLPPILPPIDLGGGYGSSGNGG